MKKLHVRISEIAQKKPIEILDHLEIEWLGESQKKYLSRFDDKVKQVRNILIAVSNQENSQTFIFA